MFSMVEAVKPGFINLTLSSSYLAEFLNTMAKEDNFGFEKTKEPKKVIIDYGGPNVAKPLHVGHLLTKIWPIRMRNHCKFCINMLCLKCLCYIFICLIIIMAIQKHCHRFIILPILQVQKRKKRQILIIISIYMIRQKMCID